MLPKSFQLGGIKWKVKKSKNLRDSNRDELRGDCDWDKSTIKISTTDENKLVSDEVMEQTFYHEIVHAILITMDHPLKYDEQFVQTFSTLIHQFEKSKK